MRKKYNTVGWFEKKELEKNAKQIKDRIRHNQVQYRMWLKARLDDFGKTVVETLF